MKNVILFLCMMAHLCCFGTKYEKAAGRLATRLFPDSVASRFMFEQIVQTDGGKDLFELESAGNNIIVRGSSANAMAVGLNHYLKYYCKTSVSWYKDDPVELPETLPAVEHKIRVEARMNNRFFSELLHVWLYHDLVAVGRLGTFYRLDGSQRSEYASGHHWAGGDMV